MDACSTHTDWSRIHGCATGLYQMNQVQATDYLALADSDWCCCRASSLSACRSCPAPTLRGQSASWRQHKAGMRANLPPHQALSHATSRCSPEARPPSSSIYIALMVNKGLQVSLSLNVCIEKVNMGKSCQWSVQGPDLKWAQWGARGFTHGARVFTREPIPSLQSQRFTQWDPSGSQGFP